MSKLPTDCTTCLSLHQQAHQQESGPSRAVAGCICRGAGHASQEAERCLLKAVGHQAQHTIQPLFKVSGHRIETTLFQGCIQALSCNWHQDNSPKWPSTSFEGASATLLLQKQHCARVSQTRAAAFVCSHLELSRLYLRK